MSAKHRTQTEPTQDQEMDAVHRRIDEVMRMIQTLSLLTGNLGAGGPGSGASGACSLTFSPASLAISVPTNDTGQVGQSITVTSAIAQTVTFSAAYVGTVLACLGALVVTPSTFTFAAGQSTTIFVTVPYTNCLTSGLVAHISLSGTTSLGCTATAAVTGTATTSNAGTFVLETDCENVGNCGAQFGIWGAVSFNPNAPTVNVNCGTCPGGADSCSPPNLCQGFGTVISFGFRVRSVNGFAGTVTLSCITPLVTDCNGNSNDSCAGFPASVAILSGQTVTIISTWSLRVQGFTNRQGLNSVINGSTLSVQGTSGSISRIVLAEAFAKFPQC